MSDNKSQGDSPEVKSKLLAAFAAKLKAKFGPKEDQPSDVERLRNRAIEINQKVAKLWLPIDNAIRAKGDTIDPKTAAATIAKMYLDEFCQWPKEDLLQLLVLMHVENAIQQII